MPEHLTPKGSENEEWGETVGGAPDFIEHIKSLESDKSLQPFSEKLSEVFHFPDTPDYTMTTQEMFKKAETMPNGSKALVQQMLGDNRINWINREFSKLKPELSEFLESPYHEKNRVLHAKEVEQQIRMEMERKDVFAAPEQTEENKFNFAFEAILYRMADTGVFGTEDPVEPILTSDFDDYINAGPGRRSKYNTNPGREVAHVIDAAFSLPIGPNGEHVPIAISATTSADRGGDGRKPTAMKKLEKYPKDGYAFLEFSKSGTTGKIRPPEFMPCFVIGLERSKIREMANTSQFDTSKVLQNSVMMQMLLQSYMRLDEIKEAYDSTASDKKILGERYETYRGIASHCLSVLKKNNMDIKSPYHPSDASGAMVLASTNAMRKKKKPSAKEG